MNVELWNGKIQLNKWIEYILFPYKGLFLLGIRDHMLFWNQYAFKLKAIQPKSNPVHISSIF